MSRCTHLSGGDQRAVKVIRKKSGLRREQQLTEIRREVDAMRKLDHPNILKVFAVYDGLDDIAIVTEL